MPFEARAEASSVASLGLYSCSLSKISLGNEIVEHKQKPWGERGGWRWTADQTSRRFHVQRQVSSSACKSSYHESSPNMHVTHREGHRARDHFHWVRKRRSPMSPSPGLIIPRSSVPGSTPPTQSSTPSGHSSAARLRPPSLANMDTEMMRGTPQSLSVSIAAHTVEPVAMIGSTMIASSGVWT